MDSVKVIFLTFLLNYLSGKTAYSFQDEGIINKILDELQEYKKESSKVIERLSQSNSDLVGKISKLEQVNQILRRDLDQVTINADLIYEAPIGAIIAWTPKPDSNTLNPTDLPSGWVLCDGSQIEGGIWDGRMTPNLNSERRFLRGGSIEDVLAVEEESTNYRDIFFLPHDTGHDKTTAHEFQCSEFNGVRLYGLEVDSNDGRNDDYLCEHIGGDETRPKNMNVLWIMKIK